ncbi:MAG TPA: hypothetical protein VMI31_16850, partial [Fimbriimonadaceae bacterium]|nr:hypothetical protein [Fimbriimonadaceae bacterium]
MRPRPDQTISLFTEEAVARILTPEEPEHSPVVERFSLPDRSAFALHLIRPSWIASGLMPRTL